MRIKYTTRRIFIIFLIIVFSVSLFPLYGKNTDSAVTLHRFALIIGSNDGGNGRVLLRYATKDALSFAQVMKDMGAVYEDNIIILLDPEKDQVLSAFKEMRKKVALYKGAPGRKEFLVYYSGHSDDQGLLLFGDKFSYKQFRDEISNVKAEVRVAILDSCSSGAFTRAKGVIRQPPFLVDSSSKMEGYAFLTSSAEDEAAQESDSIKASFFTHYLISGLRGAADISNDGMVTLNEVYSHAFSETLARTEKTQYGPQHPKYDIQLTGSGDLVLTDLRETSASLLLADELEGRLFIRDTSGNLVVELRKTPGHTVSLGLEPGRYEILLNQKENLFEGSILLKKNDRKLLQHSHLKKIKQEDVVARGDNRRTEEVLDNNIENEENKDRVVLPFHYTIFPSLFQPSFFDASYIYSFSLNLLIGFAANINGGHISSIGNIVNYHMHGGQCAGIFNFVRGNMYGFQGSGIGNIVWGKVSGFQGGGIFNFVDNDAKFVQGAGIINITLGTMTGFQGAGIINVTSGEFDGFQGAGIGNYAASVNGFQGAGLINISSGTIDGFQGAGLCNFSASLADGAQIAGLGNFANGTSGAQIAGILNITKELHGFQGGLINVAGEVSGFQLGLINIADKYTHGFPLGLISIEKDGVFYFDVWHDTAGYTNLGLRFGTRFTYVLLTGAMMLDSDPFLWSYGLGWGIHIPVSIFSLDTDITCNSINIDEIDWSNYEDGIDLLPRIRVSLGVNISNYLTLFAGYMLNVYVPWFDNDYNPDNCREINIPFTHEAAYFDSEFFAGVSLHL